MKNYTLRITLKNIQEFSCTCTKLTLDYVLGDWLRDDKAQFFRFDKRLEYGFMILKSEIVSFDWSEYESCDECEESPQDKTEFIDLIKTFLEGFNSLSPPKETNDPLNSLKKCLENLQKIEDLMNIKNCECPDLESHMKSDHAGKS